MNFLNLKFALFIGVLMPFNEKSRNVGAMLVRYSCGYFGLSILVLNCIFNCTLDRVMVP